MQQQKELTQQTNRQSYSNNTQSSFQCIVKRKHFFSDRKYYLQLTSQQLTMSQEPLFQNSKYIYSLNIEKIFNWIVQDNKIIGFIIPYQEKQKDFYGEPNDIIKLKEALGAFISYEKIEKFYHKGLILQTGSFGKVTREICKFTNKHVAIKTLKIQNNQSQTIKNEIEILKKLRQYQSQHLLKIKEVFRDENNFYIVTDFIDGIDLKSFLEQRQKPITMQDSLQILKQILEGVYCIHKAGIIHRDLKPANIMYHNNQITIIDFGLACFNGKQLEQYPACGTSGYSAPEVLNVWKQKQPYDQKVDLFSIGCIFYKLLTLESVFQSKTERDTYEHNKKCLININEKGPVFDLVKLFLKQDQNSRINTNEALTIVQALIEFKYFDVNLWYNKQFSNYEKGRSQCEFNQGDKVKLSKQCSLTNFSCQDLKTERQIKQKH